MSTEYDFGDELDSEGTFERLLGQLVRTAETNGIEVTRSWIVENESSHETDWEVMVLDLESADLSD